MLELFATKNILPYSDGRHGVGGDKDGDALGERNYGTHESSEWPVVQHQPDLNITFYEQFDIADLTFLVIIAIQKLYLCDVWPTASKSQGRIVYIQENENM